MTRFIFRKEEFGGMIIDQEKDLEIMLNQTAFIIASLAFKDSYSSKEIVSYLKVEFPHVGEMDLVTKIRCLVEDLESYFTIGNGERVSWQSSYQANGLICALTSPVSVFWEITSGCNLRCLHCYNSSGGEHNDDLTTSECQELIQELSDLGVSKLIIGGGEPFYRQDLIEIIEFANSLGLKILIATNGTLLTEEHCLRLKRINRLKLDLSLHHISRDKVDSFCGVKGTFDRQVQAMERLKANNIRFGVQTMLTEDNKTELPEFIPLLEHYDVVNWNLKTGVNIGREMENKACLTDGQVLKMQGILEELLKEKDRRIKIHSEIPLRRTIAAAYERVENKDTQISCGAGFRNCGILPNGYLVPCSFLREKEWISQYSVRDRCFKELWDYSAIFQPFRHLNTQQLGLCNNCSLLGKGCNGGCRARAVNECGDFYARDPRCRLRLSG